jgi:type II secretory pathway pseudopilin PulG
MKYHFKYISPNRYRQSAFSLIEAVAAVTVLAIIVSTVLVIFTRCSAAATNSTLKIQALEVARENMEAMLAAETIPEQTEYGYSEKYPAITWTKKVETFYEPINKKMWLRAICSAEYENHSGESQQVELIHWLTKLNEEQTQQVLNAKKELQDLATELGLSDINELMEISQPDDRLDDLLSPEDFLNSR